MAEPKVVDNAAAQRFDLEVDGGTAFHSLNPQGLHIWWGAYLGMPHQMIFSGPLADTAGTIIEARAKARAQHGWIMDSYILKRVTE